MELIKNSKVLSSFSASQQPWDTPILRFACGMNCDSVFGLIFSFQVVSLSCEMSWIYDPLPFRACWCAFCRYSTELPPKASGCFCWQLDIF